MISEVSCDTEDCWKFSFAITGINYIFKYIKIENQLLFLIIKTIGIILHNNTVITVYK